MTPYHNPRVFLANLVKFEYNREERKYIPLILSAKIPVVLMPGYGYYTDKLDVNMPLSIVDVNNFNHVSTNKYYITNVKSIHRYTDNPNELLHNWFVSSLKLNEELGLDGKWHTKDDINLDKPVVNGPLPEADMKLDENLYIAKMAYLVKRIQNYQGALYKDEYIHISNNYGLFSYDKGVFTSKTTGYMYDELEYKDLHSTILSFDIDLAYSSTPIYKKEELGLTNIYDLHDFVSSFRLYIDPKKNVLKQINEYESLKTDINLRTLKDLSKFRDSITLSNKQYESLNKEIMQRTLKK